MSEIEKTFIVPAAWAQRYARKVMVSTGMLNSRKMGRTRRGGWMMRHASCQLHDDGTASVSVLLQKAPPMPVTIARDGNSENFRRVKFPIYKCGNVSKVLKDLRVAEKRLGRR